LRAPGDLVSQVDRRGDLKHLCKLERGDHGRHFRETLALVRSHPLPPFSLVETDEPPNYTGF
jgi:hypothetical protein